EAQVLTVPSRGRGFVGGKQVNSPSSHAGGKAEAKFLWADGNQFADRAFHHHRVGEVDEVNRQRFFLAPNRYVKDARTGDGHRGIFVSGPVRCVAQEFKVVHALDLPECAVDVPREIENATG